MGEFTKPHFYYKSTDIKAHKFAQNLIADLGEYSQDDCDVIVTLPGDGTIYHAFHNAVNKPVFALKPPKSSSLLFGGHHKIKNGTRLLKALSNVEAQIIHPLQTTIYLSDGTTRDVHSYVDINIRSDNAQATLIQEHINDIPSTKHPVMGSGWIIATPLGSTALNETRGGEVIHPSERSIVRTMNGVSNYYERKKLNKKNKLSIIVPESSVFNIRVASNQEKRATKIDFDSWSILPDGEFQEPHAVHYDTFERHIERVVVTTNQSANRARTLLTNKKYKTPNPFI